MDNRPEEFEKLRKLLKIKQHEQPPPGYFSNFSTLVINRIERQGGTDSFLTEVPWLRRLFQTFERSPVIGGLIGSALCGVVIFGIAMANQTDKVPDGGWRPQGVAKNNSQDKAISDSGAFASTADTSARSTDVLFSSNGPSSSLSVTPVSYTTAAPAPAH